MLFETKFFNHTGPPLAEFFLIYRLFEILLYTAIWQICVGSFFFERGHAQNPPNGLYFGPFSKHLFHFSKDLPWANFFFA